MQPRFGFLLQFFSINDDSGHSLAEPYGSGSSVPFLFNQKSKLSRVSQFSYLTGSMVGTCVGIGVGSSTGSGIMRSNPSLSHQPLFVLPKISTAASEPAYRFFPIRDPTWIVKRLLPLPGIFCSRK
jgi:hypothetical protein